MYTLRSLKSLSRSPCTTTQNDEQHAKGGADGLQRTDRSDERDLDEDPADQ
jgi:hypothetical protein